jgi:predicted nucleic acid-binding protein
VKYLLDANCWIDHFRRGPASNVTAHLAAEKPGNIYLCSLVVGELLYGVLRGAPEQQASNTALVDSVRRRFVSLPFDDRAAEEYAKARALLASTGKPIGPNDLIYCRNCQGSWVHARDAQHPGVQPNAWTAACRLGVVGGNRALIHAKKLESNGKCTVCEFSFAERYAALARDCLVAHHVKPIGKRNRPSRTTLDDIDLLCPNCHSVVHTEDPPITANDLRKRLIRQAIPPSWLRGSATPSSHRGGR